MYVFKYEGTEVNRITKFKTVNLWYFGNMSLPVMRSHLYVFFFFYRSNTIKVTRLFKVQDERVVYILKSIIWTSLEFFRDKELTSLFWCSLTMWLAVMLYQCRKYVLCVTSFAIYRFGIVFVYQIKTSAGISDPQTF